MNETWEGEGGIGGWENERFRDAGSIMGMVEKQLTSYRKVSDAICEQR